MPTSGFDRLPQTAKVVHAVALCLIGMNVILMMTPAALHRLSFGREDSPRFFRLGSALVSVGPAFLAAGISTETYVVFLKALNTPQAAIAASIAALIVLTGFGTSGPFHFDNPAGWLHEDHFSRYRWRAELRQDI